MAKNLYWLKRTAILQDPKMVYILSKGAVYYVIWLLLQDVAAHINDDGKIYLTTTTPMDTAVLAKQIQQKKSYVTKGLDLFEQLDLLRRDDQGFIQLLPWDDLQDFTKREKEREQNRIRVARHREKQAAMQAVVEQATVGDDVQSSCEKNALSPALQQYQQYWGQVNPVIARKLTDMVEDWGSDAVCAAIDIAYEKGKNHINYIQAVLVNSNGQPERKESAYEKWEREFNRSLDAVFCEIEQDRQSGKDKTHVRSPAGHDSRTEPRPQSTLAPALQI